MSGADFAALLPNVARRLLGDPPRLGADEWRYGSHADALRWLVDARMIDPPAGPDAPPPAPRRPVAARVDRYQNRRRGGLYGVRGALVALPPAPARREPLTAPERTNPAQFRPAAPW